MIGNPHTSGSRSLTRRTISGSTGVNGNAGSSRSGTEKAAESTSRENADAVAR